MVSQADRGQVAQGGWLRRAWRVVWRVVWRERSPTAAPLIATIGALLLLVAAWAPWVGFMTSERFILPSLPDIIGGPDGLLQAFVTTHFTQNSAFESIDVAWDILFLLGTWIGATLALIQRASRAAALLRVIYPIWVGIATLAIGVALYSDLVLVPPAACPEGCPQPSVIGLHLMWGAWLAIGALLIAWLGVALLWRRPDHTPLPAQAPRETTPSVRRQRLATVLYSAGAALWVVGLLVLPWATSDCAGFAQLTTVFSHRYYYGCAGVSGFDSLLFGLNSSSVLPFMQERAVLTSRVIELALTGSTLAVIVIQSRYTWKWSASVALWLAILTALTAFTIYGATVAVQPPQPQLAYEYYPTTAWIAGVGAFVAGAGLALCWLGIGVMLVAHRAMPSAESFLAPGEFR